TALIPLVAICAATITPSGSSRQAVAQDVPAAEHTPAAVDPKGFERYVGFYRADRKVLPDLVFTVTREGNHLFEQRTGANKLGLFSDKDQGFFHGGLDSRDGRITFMRDAQGRTTGLVLHQNGMDITATRTDEAEARRAADLREQRLADQARPRTAITIDPSLFDRYVGSYALNPRLVFRITRDNDRFFTQLTGQPKIEIVPESETGYFAKIVKAQITFVIDGQRVTGLVLHQNGREFPANR